MNAERGRPGAAARDGSAPADTTTPTEPTALPGDVVPGDDAGAGENGSAGRLPSSGTGGETASRGGVGREQLLAPWERGVAEHGEEHRNGSARRLPEAVGDPGASDAVAGVGDGGGGGGVVAESSAVTGSSVPGVTGAADVGAAPIEVPVTGAAGAGAADDAGVADDAGAKRASRAGRNLPAAIAVGLGLGAVILLALLTYRQLFLIVVAAAVAVSTVELAGALRRGAGIRLPLVPLLVGGQAMVWLTWPFGLTGLLVSFVLTVLACLVWRMRAGADGYLRDGSASLFAAAYVPMFAAFAALLVEPVDGVGRVLCFMIAVVCSDTGGYTAGVLFGKHPMAPTISPKKSWEGFAGSLVVGIAGGVLSVLLLLDGQWWQGALFGAAIVASATVGDLLESLLKRDLGIKDMGTLLPGHGGIMDRMDSMLPSAVLSWMMLALLVPGS